LRNLLCLKKRGIFDTKDAKKHAFFQTKQVSEELYSSACVIQSLEKSWLYEKNVSFAKKSQILQKKIVNFLYMN